MRKRILSSLVVVFTVFNLCSCGSSNEISDTKREGIESIIREDVKNTTEEASEDKVGETENVLEVHIGDVFTLSDGINELEITLNSVDFEQEVHSLVEDTNQFSQYYPDIEGETFVVMKLYIKNIGGNSISDEVFEDYNSKKEQYNEIIATFDNKYNYQMIQLDTQSIVMSSYWYLEPLKSQAVYFLQSIPDEIIDKPYIIEFSLAEGDLVCRYSGKGMSEEENSNIDSSSTLKFENPEEEKYQAALEAESNNFYAYALRLFEEVVNYEDSNEHIEALKDILEPYNGDYTVEMFGGGTYSMKINNGIVKTQINDVDGALEYYFDIIGYQYENGEGIVMASASDFNDDGIPERGGDSSYKNSDFYSIRIMDNGGFMILAMEGNDYTYWNGATR